MNISFPDYYHLNENVLGIEVHCTGTPRPKIKWYHDVIEIKPSFKYTLLEEAHGVFKVEIFKPASKDSGKYVCKAENKVGHAEIVHAVHFGKSLHYHFPGMHHAHSLLLKEKEDAAKRAMEDVMKAHDEYEARKQGRLPPLRKEELPSVPKKDRLKIVTQLRDRLALVGNKLKFIVAVVGPDPNIRWQKDGNWLSYGPNIRNLQSEGTSILEISKLGLEHSGEYTCVARNDKSDAQTSCVLKVYEAKTEGRNQPPLFVHSIRGE